MARFSGGGGVPAGVGYMGRPSAAQRGGGAGGGGAAQQKPDVRAARLPNSYHIINDDFPRTCCIASAECQ